MMYSQPDSITIRYGALLRSSCRTAVLLGLCVAILSITFPKSSRAQAWDEESDYGDSYSTNAEVGPGGSGSSSGWSLRTGVGFTADPTTFLLNLELPYAFDQWIFAGPMLQLGFDDDNTIVAPTLNVGLTFPDLPGQAFDRVHPYGFTGIGFAYIDKDNRGSDDTGFLVHFGFGLEYEVNKNLFLGSQMMFNFLPKRTAGEQFFYSWQIVGARIAF